MNSNDPFAEPQKKPCKCHEHETALSGAELAAGAMPTIDDVETALAELGAAAAPESLELELAALDAALDDVESFELDSISSGPGVGMEELLALAERYPGLKITFSF